ncbi:unnamed protein product [Schistocephalus solidus]|uniref:Uncharacterized protein n=1 Tax=Schistocephalus solidus TaxID=70667 RepID=A0A3P7BIV8_SCHSO|nr:unnamed protein product [Schistocephalus solidus]
MRCPGPHARFNDAANEFDRLARKEISCHRFARITSLPFVHTARHYYQLLVLVRGSDQRHCSASHKVGARQVPRRRPNLII